MTYTLTTIDSAKDKRNTDIWMMSWDGSEKVQLTNSPDGESNPRWSPDGKFISFTAARNGGSNQVYLLNRLGGEAIKLTDVKGELGDYVACVHWMPHQLVDAPMFDAPVRRRQAETSVECDLG